jgi:uncharacterized protein YqjF (DUF2071 family)
MNISKIAENNHHRPWPLPSGSWKYYQEWNRVVFLHWQVSFDDLRKRVPSQLQIDTIDGQAWVSLVAFTMEKIRPRYIPHFPPISNFHEVNIRTYVKYNGKSGVYFLSIEGGKGFSCFLARQISGLPYRFSNISRIENHYFSKNNSFKDELLLNYSVGKKITEPIATDKWLTERYALFHVTNSKVATYELHHLPWEVHELTLENSTIKYSRFESLFGKVPEVSHYSNGVKVLAWGKEITP